MMNFGDSKLIIEICIKWLDYSVMDFPLAIFGVEKEQRLEGNISAKNKSRWAFRQIANILLLLN